MTGPLDGKVALVVGAGADGDGTSIGRATALTFARKGAEVFAVGIDAASAQQTSPWRHPCLASRRENPVKLIPYEHEAI